MENNFKQTFKQRVLPFKNITDEYIVDNNIYINRKLAILGMIDARRAELGFGYIDIDKNNNIDIIKIAVGALVCIVVLLIAGVFRYGI
jgi:hypothetical protein